MKFLLVQFYQQAIYCVCNKNTTLKRNGTLFAKFEGKYYEAKILLEHNSKIFLENFLDKLTSNVSVLLVRNSEKENNNNSSREIMEVTENHIEVDHQVVGNSKKENCSNYEIMETLDFSESHIEIDHQDIWNSEKENISNNEIIETLDVCENHIEIDQASLILKENIFPYLREDIVKCIRYDKLLIHYFNQLCVYQSSDHLEMIRSQMRLTGCFLLNLKGLDASVQSLSDVFEIKRFDCVIEVIARLGDYEEASRLMKKPSIPLHMKTLLKKITKFFISECIKKSDDISQKRGTDFLSLITTSTLFRTTQNKELEQGSQSDSDHDESVEDVKINYISPLNTSRCFIVANFVTPKTSEIQGKRWSAGEEKLLKAKFKTYYNSGEVPSLTVCKKIIEENIILRGRTPAMVKAKVRNDLRKQ